jgi:predicted nucleotidyltransferase
MGDSSTLTELLDRVRDAEARRFVREKWDVIEERFAPVHVILFGSRAHGTPHIESDLDVIVVSERFSPIRFVNRAFQFKRAVRPHLGMDVLCYTPKEFEKLKTGVGIVADASREGIWLK